MIAKWVFDKADEVGKAEVSPTDWKALLDSPDVKDVSSEYEQRGTGYIVVAFVGVVERDGKRYTCTAISNLRELLYVRIVSGVSPKLTRKKKSTKR